MVKKAIPLVLMSGLVLTACTNNHTVPRNNETPMESLEDRTRDWTPRVNDERTGPDFDGLDHDRGVNRNGGIINDNNGVRNGVINGTTPNGVMNDGTTTTPREEIIIEDDRNRNTRKPQAVKKPLR